MLQGIQEIPQECLHTFQLFIHAIKKTLVTTFLFLEYVHTLLECLSQRVQSLSAIGQNDLQLLVNGVYLLIHWTVKHSKLVIQLT